MYTRVTKKALLLLATGLLLTGCTDPKNDASSDNSDNISNNSGTDSYTSDNSGVPGTSSLEKSSIDYTKGWDPAIDSEIRRSLHFL